MTIWSCSSVRQVQRKQNTLHIVKCNDIQNYIILYCYLRQEIYCAFQIKYICVPIVRIAIYTYIDVPTRDGKSVENIRGERQVDIKCNYL